MKDKTKKWLVTAGLAVVCIGLVFGISRVLYREPVQEVPIGEKDTGETEITVDIGKTENIQAEEAADTEKTGTGKTLVTEIDTSIHTAGDKEQELQPEPEKTEKEKPDGPPAASEGDGTEEKTEPSADGTPKETEKKPSEEKIPKENAPSHGDTKDGMIYIDGFGWIPNEGGGGSGITAEDMYENGNKIGIMD